MTVRQGNRYTTTLPLEVFKQRNLAADFIRSKLNFIFKNKKSLFEPPFGGLRGNDALHLYLVGEPVINFLFVVIELSSLSLMVETL